MNNLIRRSAVLGMAFCAIKPTHDCQSVVSVVNVEDIENIPAIDAVPVVHARWKKTYDLIDGHDGYKCSACGYTKYFDHYSEDITLRKPYCCNCGARMDGEADG